MPPYSGRYALANPGGEITAFNINNDINVFGIQTRINTTYTQSFPDIRDAPVQLERPKLDAQWWDNLLTGVMFTLALAACAALTIATCGAGAASFALVGAAIGAAAVTTAVSVADAKTGRGRSADEFAKEILLGAGIGAIAGACIYWVGPALMSELTGKIGGLTLMSQGALAQASAYIPALARLVPYVPTIAKWTGYTIFAVSGARKANDCVEQITGENLILDLIFCGDYETYNNVSTFFDAVDEVWDQMPEVDLNTPTPNRSTNSNTGTDSDAYEPPQPLNEAAQKYIDQSVNSQMNAVDSSVNAQMDYVNTSVNSQMNAVDIGTNAMTSQLDGSPSTGTGGGTGSTSGGSSGSSGLRESSGGSGNSGVIITNSSGTCGRNSILSMEEAENFAFDAIHGANNADAVVLGKYDGGGPTAYTSVAEDMGAQYFQLDNWDDIEAQYSDDEIWKINERFLDIQTSSGREIYLSHDPNDYLGKGDFFSRELQYLLDNGYHFVNEGGIWHAIR